jgi:hypothetical protein
MKQNNLNKHLNLGHRLRIADNAVCQSCDWEGRPEDTLPIPKLIGRVVPGDIMPYGECPVCGAVAIPAYSMETQDVAARSLLGVCLKAFNEIPNRRIASANIKTFSLANRISHFLGRVAMKQEADHSGGGV